MDIQDQGKDQSSVQESQVHVCNKCGWPYPKPHPSARHRRSHKKICGTIEGYELIDEEQVSDEYHKTSDAQVPKVMENCNLERSIGGIGAMSNRSEDEVFSDAMEFRDGGFGLGRQDSSVRATISDKDLTPNISFKDCEDASGDVIPIETKPPMDFSEECREVRGGDKVAESSVDGDGNELDNLNGNISADVVQLDEESDTLGKTFIMLPDAAEVVTVSDTCFESNEVFRKTEKENESVDALSVREDIPVVENADIELEGFKDRNTVKLPRSEAVASEEMIVKDELVEGKADVIQLDKGSDTLGSFVDADATENEKASEVGSLEENQLIYVSDDLRNADPTVSRAESARTGVFDIAEDVNTRRSEKEYDAKNSLTSNESTNDSSLSQTNPASNELEVENSTFELVSPHQESPVVTKEGNDKYTSVLETENQHSNIVSNSLDDKVYRECADEDLRISAGDNIEGNEFEKISRDQLKESIHSPSYPEPTDQHSDSFDDSHTRESGVGASGTSTVNLQREVDNHSIQAQSDAAVGDGQCGSVSVFSTRSDNAALIDTGNSTLTGSLDLEPEKANIKEPSVASEQILDKSDEFEPPSFSTLIDPGGNDQTAAAPEIQNKENPGADPLQAGWFPSLTHAMNESEGRKKNEETIEKVTTNWNAKQHIPLKSLLGEAINETRPKSPIESSRDEKVVAKDDRGVTVTKVSSILGPESPTNHQDEFTGVKRKGKGRPLWVQFVCCSSVN